MRPIDADALIAEIKGAEKCYRESMMLGSHRYPYKLAFADGAGAVADLIVRQAPTIEERKHGHWMCHWQEGVCFEKRVECSVCGNNETTNNPEWAYCPHCGAEMDGEDNV